MNFPYEIRKVPAGQMVIVPDGENTVSYSVQYSTPFTMQEEGARNEGAHLPVMSPWGWVICSVALSCPDNDKEVLFAMAKENLDGLPDLKHKFMLVYHTDEWKFENCFLVATDNEDWWRDFAVLEERK